MIKEREWNKSGRIGTLLTSLQTWLFKEVPIAPLVTFRILFGALMCYGTLRFIAAGWIETLYVEPDFFFKFFGFEWVFVPGPAILYGLFIILAILSFFISIGFLYRISTLLFFLGFSYVELMDATHYLNHYYLVVLLAFLLVFLPGNRAFSIDAYIWPDIKKDWVPNWTIGILLFQLACVYFFAGLAKISADWMLQALPMAIWLPERANFPILGTWFQEKWVAYVFSWAGAFYDLTIVAFLFWKRTRVLAYVAVVVFHLLTWSLFNIGLFPLIMISSTLLFFSAEVHQKLLGLFGYQPTPEKTIKDTSNNKRGILKFALASYIIIQLFLPLRHLAYTGNLLWNEEGYRFSWRVMLVEKSGLATFTVSDGASAQKSEIVNGNYLTRFQEKQMAIQPDFIVQFAQFLAWEFEQKHGFQNPKVTVDAHVALNGRMSQRFIDPKVDLTEVPNNFTQKEWVLPFKN